MNGKPCTLYATYCADHEFVHGAEAEELRAGIERVIENLLTDKNRVSRSLVVERLQRLLDKVDARDSLAWREAEDSSKAKGE